MIYAIRQNGVLRTLIELPWLRGKRKNWNTAKKPAPAQRPAEPVRSTAPAISGISDTDTARIQRDLDLLSMTALSAALADTSPSCDPSPSSSDFSSSYDSGSSCDSSSYSSSSSFGD